MGNPLSPLLACIYMEEFEKKALQLTKSSIMFYARYVDDCFLISSNIADLKSFLIELNKQDPSGKIQFTHEFEKDAKLPFLDCLLERKSTKLSVTVYHKPTDSGRYTHFSSCQPIQQKTGTISSLARRIHQISSDHDGILTEKQKLTENLTLCNYPKKIIEGKMMPIGARKKPKERPNIHISLPFYPKLTHVISKFLGRFGVETFTNKGLTLGHALYKNSPEIPPKDVIYKIPCLQCPISYVGKTTRHLQFRIKEHQRDIKQNKKESAVAKHVSKTGHQMNFDETKVIARISNGNYLSALEQAMITATDATCNKVNFEIHSSFASLSLQ